SVRVAYGVGRLRARAGALAGLLPPRSSAAGRAASRGLLRARDDPARRGVRDAARDARAQPAADRALPAECGGRGVGAGATRARAAARHRLLVLRGAADRLGAVTRPRPGDRGDHDGRRTGDRLLRGVRLLLRALPSGGGTRPAVLEQRAHALDAGAPDLEHLLV